MLRPEVVLDILQNFTLFATDKKHRRIKIICRYQQYFTTNQIVERVVKGYPKKGLIWHFQGSGKSLLMVFAAQKLRLHPKLGNPTVIIVVDRIDLDTQITATFNAADVPNMVGVATRQELQTLLAQDVRKVLITTIHKFGEAGGKLNERSNIIVMVDEAHRTQEGDLGRKMREALAECVPVRPHRHAHQSRGQKYVLGVRRGRGRKRLHEPLLVPGIHPRQGHAAAALRGTGGAAEDRQGGH